MRWLELKQGYDDCMLSLLLPIVIFVLANTLVGSYLIIYLQDYNLSQETMTLLFGVALIGAIISIASIFMYAAKIQGRKTPKSIGGFVLSIVSVVLFIGYIIFRFVIRIHSMGLTLF